MRSKRKKIANKIGNFFKDNSLSIAFTALFIGSLIAQSFSGLSLYNHQQTSHGSQPVSYFDFLCTGTFLDGAFCNWQAAILQLATLIIFSEILYQRGAAHSRKPEHPKKHSRGRSWFYCNSLSIAFVALFLAAFILHVIFGTREFNEERQLQNQKSLTISEFFVSAKFWFSVFQTWEAEFFAIVVFLILTIFLRQENSAESKSPSVGNKATGDPNE